MAKRASIGQQYQQLIEALPDDVDVSKMKWENKLGVSDVRIETSLELANRILMTGRARSQHYMALYDLYYTPSKMVRWGMNGGEKCNRCGLFAADSHHMFFSCPSLGKFWGEFENFLGEIFGFPIRITGEMVIIGVGSDSGANERSEETTALLFIIMAAVRACITSEWISPEPPTFINWRSRFLSIYNFDVSIYKTKGINKRAMGVKIWAPITEWAT